jgi:hypothetical protein
MTQKVRQAEEMAWVLTSRFVTRAQVARSTADPVNTASYLSLFLVGLFVPFTLHALVGIVL